jgi:aarF domain-containing kinase
MVVIAAPLPTVYDAAAIARHFETPYGSSRLRARAFLIVRTVASLAPVVLTGSASAPSAMRGGLTELGPTAIKFGQAAANRPDLVGFPLADELRLLQDSVAPFSTEVARRLIREGLEEERADEILRVLPEEPAAAASLSQVYRVELPANQQQQFLAVKVLRPDAREAVAMDAALARKAAEWAESLRVPGGGRLLQPALVEGVDEFFSRLFEEMDLQHEIENLELFDSLYGANGSAAKRLRKAAGGGEIIVPAALRQWSGGSVLSMSWVEGEPLLAKGAATLDASSLPLVRFGIEATLSQMLSEGVMHADPHGAELSLDLTTFGSTRCPSPCPACSLAHPDVDGSRLVSAGGNLLRPSRGAKDASKHGGEAPRLAYLDFGLVSRVPLQVREGLCCAVALLLFNRDIEAVAETFGDLMLLPREALEDAATRRELTAALERLADKVLLDQTSSSSGGGGGGAMEDGDLPLPQPQQLPRLQFNELITELALLAPRFAFKLPPYFLNNARALATLEGMARSADPDFDVLQVVYPFALRRLLADPRASPRLRATLVRLTHNERGQLDAQRLARLLQETARLSGRSRRRVVWDAARSPGGRAFFARDVLLASCKRAASGAWAFVRRAARPRGGR